MTKLAAWSIDGQHAEGASQQSEPKRIGRSQIGLERHLEDWIANDVTLIAEGLTLVGRQITIDDGRLDLLAIDSQDRWLVIEIKPGLLDSGALAQALYYASSIARLGADELYGKLEARLGDFGDAETLSARVKQQLNDEAEGREIAVMLVGAGIHPGLERMNEFLGRFGVPISVVSFEVFELDGGPQLLIREVVDEPTEPPAPRRRLTVDAIRRWAVDVGVGEQFDRFVKTPPKTKRAMTWPKRAEDRSRRSRGPAPTGIREDRAADQPYPVPDVRAATLRGRRRRVAYPRWSETVRGVSSARRRTGGHRGSRQVGRSVRRWRGS